MKKILIISPAWIGDAIMADSLYQRLKATDPKCQIHVLAPKAVQALHERMASVDKVIPFNVKRGKLALAQRYTMGKALRREGYDTAYVLPNSWKSALAPWFARIPKRIGWLGEMRYVLLNHWHKLDKTELPLMVQRFVALSCADPTRWDKQDYPTPHLQVDTASLKATLQKLKLNKRKPILAFCPGAAYGPAKRWPARYFAEVAKQKTADGYQVWLFGGPDDQSVCDEIDALSGNQCVNLGGKTSLIEMVDLLSLAKHVITNDTGPMHVAAALGVPLIALFGSSSPYFTPPLSDKVQIISIDDLPCKPCFERVCPLGHMKCLNDITPGQVLALL